MNQPLVVCVTPTYGRFHLLPEMLWCWTQQTYENKQLIIVNDQPNFTIECDVPGVTVVNVPERFPGLGAKRNFIAKQVPEEAVFVVTMDDDDLFLSNHVASLVAVMPSQSMRRSRSGVTYVTDDNRFTEINTTWPCYGASCFHAKDFRSFWMQDIYVWGEDVDMLNRYGVKHVITGNGTFIYRRGMGIVHASGHPGMHTGDMMHHAIIHQQIQFGTEHFKTPTVGKLVPCIQPESMLLFREIEQKEREKHG